VDLVVKWANMKKTLLISMLLFAALACSSLQLPTAPTPFPTSTVQLLPTLVVPTPTAAQAITLRSLAEEQEYWIGTAVSYEYLRSDEAYADLVAREFNLLTTEDDLKFGPVHPEADRYDFEAGDALVAFAQANVMAVRGHTLVWDSQNPEWLAAGNYNREALMNILRDHIYTVVGRYRGQMEAWDVVNEALDENGDLRDTIWLRGIGPDYIALAFQWAHEADPQAKLFYNDQAAEGMNAKSEGVYQLVKGLRDRGIPIHGVGMQMHVELEAAPPPGEVAANMARLGELGLEVQITEMDVRVGPEISPEKLQRQADIYRDMLSVCLEAENCDTLVVWGATDAYSWLPKLTGSQDAGVLFDTNYEPKPAWEALVETLKPDE
jgi:endo-1,4-beta-xylanase